ncbi:hypothetical protein [Anaerococcus cruorum]|uniref:hypothetical protein n=1 Tax=Anaerococcus sp. WGS1529 TaxID=3366812 RepID=UPI00372D4521
MSLEEKRDNKVDSKKNGRPVSFSTGDGDDFVIDLPGSIPGEENTNTNDMNDDEIENLISDIDSKNAEIEDLLHEMGVKDINKLLEGDYSDLDLE